MSTPSDDPDRTRVRPERSATGSHSAETAAHRSLSAETPPPSPGLPSGLLTVPGFLVEKELARGGMGVVLVAREIALKREVAIKTLLPGTGCTENATRRFLEEARITARLQHPGIPPVHQVGELPDGRPFLAMKLIRGRTLAAVLAAREQRPSSHSADLLELTALDSPGLLSVFEHICQTVAYAHSQGVVHRDLKPANVMVGGFGEVQVMDWGLAKSGDRKQEPGNKPDARGTAETHNGTCDTQFGQALGTPQYMPPEQARGAWAEVGTRADVFALGGILCAILTGKPPYTGANPIAVLRRAEAADLAECFARLDSCAADRELIALAKRCLSPEPAFRPPDGAAVVALLQAFRLNAEERLRKAEATRAALVATAAEARLRAAAEHRAKVVAEERAAEALTREEQARRTERLRGKVMAGLAATLSLAIAAYLYGGHRAAQLHATRDTRLCPAAYLPHAGSPLDTFGPIDEQIIQFDRHAHEAAVLLQRELP